MTVLARIEKDYIDALKAKEELRVSVLRMVKAALKNAKIAAGKELADEEVLKEIQREAKNIERRLWRWRKRDGKICDRERKRS